MSSLRYGRSLTSSIRTKADVPTDSPIDKMYVIQLLEQLPEVQRILINMSYFEGFTHKEISEHLDLPLGTVKTRIRLAIKHLRAII